MKKIAIIFFIPLCVLLNSCNDFLEKDPKDRLTTTTAFQSYDNFKTYSWGFYSIFRKTRRITELDQNTNLLVDNASPNNNLWAYQYVTENTGNANWDFSYIRRANIMLDNIEGSELSETEKAHWRSVGLFFRSYKYFTLLSLYGDVPWLEHSLSDSDAEELYGPRASRDEVASNILRDLEEAEQNIGLFDDGDNTINQKVVQALISRFALFEGTWRKYHGLSDAKKYLEACATYSKKLIDAEPEVADNYDLLFTSQSLVGMRGVLLYFEYSEQTGLRHAGSRDVGATSYLEGTKDLVNLYLCTDGKPIGSSPLYEGDKTPYNEFRNRDYRLYYTILPPYRIKVKGNNDVKWQYHIPGESVVIGNNKYTLTQDDCNDFRYYMDLMEQISPEGHKRMPTRAWNATTLNGWYPRFISYPGGGGTPFAARFGYRYWKFYNIAECLAMAQLNSTDVPLFRIGETMVNYAEAMCELGLLDQNIADITINKLRARANVAPMKVSEIDENFDPNRDQTVSPLLWEIRRERIVELIGEDFAWNDLRRWKKGEYLEHELTGCWIKNSDFGNTLQIQGYQDVTSSADKEGYVVYRNKPLEFLDYTYLYPIPIKQLVLNPQLKQNPGYKSASN